ncbi:DUF4142 domain-containing protein [Variovorax sp. J22R24]|uniref:DUF4142 domain-containing protein n=1 Tax=Variovorax gracilis TaxID=3053502 RepID=UPI002578E4B5|nr:DUF4142 domain-containing protein [Variovorax sp. J22R24]MDM0108873.1 DUF4142 domain-containing protein [Variovorax sp. J22R24]
MKHLSAAPFASIFLLVLSVLTALPAAAVDDTEQPKPSRSMTSPEARNNNPEGEGLSKSAPSRLGKADRSFMTKAAGNGLYEIEAATLAARRASNPHVKSYAATLVRDHQQALEGLKRVAVEHNYPLPDHLAPDRRKMVERLDALSGKAFDRAFVRQVGIQGHEADIRLFQRADRATRTPDLKAWIEKTLPSLQDHLKHALELQVG